MTDHELPSPDNYGSDWNNVLSVAKLEVMLVMLNMTKISQRENFYLSIFIKKM